MECKVRTTNGKNNIATIRFTVETFGAVPQKPTPAQTKEAHLLSTVRGLERKITIILEKKNWDCWNLNSISKSHHLNLTVHFTSHFSA